MKPGMLPLLIACGLAATFHAHAAQPASDPPSQPPNVVLLYIDNVGYGDLGCYGNREVRTPHIDRLSTQGVLCTEFYTASPTCSCSRGAVLTGRQPLRNGLVRQMPRGESPGDGLPASEVLLPALLKPCGYATGCFGKWNIGFLEGLRPTERGFDEFFGHRSGNMDYYTHIYNGRNDLYRGTQQTSAEGYATDLIADAACDFLRRHKDGPMFVYVPFNAAHFPNPRNKAPGEPVIWQAPAEGFAAYGLSPSESDPKKRYRAVLTALDSGIGKILDELDALRLADRTLVILISDNGAFMLKDRGLEVASNLPLRDGGVTVWEGGIRVPCVMRWPGRIPAGSVCDEPLTNLDVLPMVVRAAGGELPKDRVIDGRDPTATLAGKAPSPHETLCFEYRGGLAIRQGKYKLLRPKTDAAYQLFDLEQDLGESTDLSAEKPELAAMLRERLESWHRELQP